MSVWKSTLLAAALLFSASPFSAMAESHEYAIDLSHSTVGFSVDHMVVSTTRGKFNEFEGKVQLDPEDLSATVVQATVKIDSIDTDDADRDKHLKADDFFAAATYPTMSFKSKKFKKARGNTYKMTGDLTLRGVTKEVTFEVEGLDKEIKDPWGNYRRGANATAVIDRQDFGLSYSDTLDTGGLMVGDDVTINLEIELIRR